MRKLSESRSPSQSEGASRSALQSYGEPCVRRSKRSKSRYKRYPVKLAHASSASIQALRDNDDAVLQRLDNEVELAMGEKERLIGALRQHGKDHGC
jgi:hypothetical protein